MPESYRLMRSYFATTSQWKDYDPFQEQKDETFRSSAAAIYRKSRLIILELAHTFAELDQEKAILDTDASKLQVLFNEMLQICLWGNATDLSLLTNMTHEDIQKLQSVGRAAQEDRKEFILLDNSDEAWKVLSSVKDGRVDLVLDNAGFEVFTDFLLADFLITHTPYVSKVVFHPKTIPWFVSDVTPKDFYTLVPILLNKSFFADYPATAEQQKDLERLVTRWDSYIKSGQFSLSVPQSWKTGQPSELADFWTSPSPYAVLGQEAPALMETFKASDLVIFKVNI
ncbi:hypothetical protein M422DRAFT_234949 [Sphaerobolus stellatus SS14]|uniref:Sugar phosphate phosphatase n=1 Tax=Sphaerobolus stellatus (strain SS14) TaxID=990650 RepID=A0A0C9TKB2_SPHS4|nr:hypothetical protein M422DRAFT_234949 [Sphaerobolus stellatus SS14]